MRHLTAYCLVSLAIIQSACKPTLTIKLSGTPAPSLPDTTECIVLGWTDTTRLFIPPIARITYQEPSSGMWDEPKVLAIVKSMTLKHGANLIRLAEVTYPGPKTRARVAADIFHVPDPRLYEKQIIWSPDRRLTLEDFKGSPLTANPPQGSSSDCELYFPILYHGKIMDIGYMAQARFNCRSSWISPLAKNPKGLLIHEQGNFDLCDLYSRQLESFVQQTTWTYANYRQLLMGIYAQIYTAWQTTRTRYEAQTNHGLDATAQAKWTRDIAAASPFFITPHFLSDAQQDNMAKALTPPPDSALVYIIRPNDFNTVFWKRLALNPMYFIVLPFLFINTDPYRVYDGINESYWLGRRNYIYRVYPPGIRDLSPEFATDSSFKGHQSLSLSLAPGKVYYVEMKLVDHRFFQFTVPVLQLLSEEAGRTLLKKCTLFNDYQGLPLPVLKDILQ